MKAMLLVTGFLPIAAVTIASFFGATDATPDAQPDLPEPERIRKFADTHAENVDAYRAGFIEPLIDRDLLSPDKRDERPLPTDSDLHWMKDVAAAYAAAKESHDVAISYRAIGNLEQRPQGPSSKEDLQKVLDRLDGFLTSAPNAGSVRDFVSQRKAGIEAELTAIDVVQQAAANLQAKDYDACIAGLGKYDRQSGVDGVKARVDEVDRLLRLAKFRKHWKDRPIIDAMELHKTARSNDERSELAESRLVLSQLLRESPTLDDADIEDQVVLDAVNRELLMLSIKLRVIEEFATQPLNVAALLETIGEILEAFKQGKSRSDPFACRETQDAFMEWLTAKGTNRLASRVAKVSPTLKQATHKNDGLVIAEFGELKAGDYYLFVGADGKDKQIYLTELRGGAVGELTNSLCVKRFNSQLAELLQAPHDRQQWDAFAKLCMDLDRELTKSESAPRAEYSLSLKNLTPELDLGPTRAMLMFDQDASIALAVIDRFAIVKLMFDDGIER